MVEVPQDSNDLSLIHKCITKKFLYTCTTKTSTAFKVPGLISFMSWLPFIKVPQDSYITKCLTNKHLASHTFVS